MGCPAPCNSSRWAGCLRCAAHPGYAGVGVPGELHHCRGRGPAALCSRAGMGMTVGSKPPLLLDGGFEQFLEMRPICASSLVISWPTSVLTVGDLASQSFSQMPAGGGSISGSLCQRSKLVAEVFQKWNRPGAFSPLSSDLSEAPDGSAPR